MSDQAKYPDLGNMEIPDGLFEKVLSRIEIERKKRKIRQRFTWFVLALLAVGLSVSPVWRSFKADLAYTGFSQYLSLAISDFGLVKSYWHDYSLGLLESLPVTSSLGLLLILFCAVFLVKSAIKNGKDFTRLLSNNLQ